MRKFLCDDAGAVTTDWVVLAAAIFGLGVAVLSMISTGSLDLANRTSQILNDTEVAIPSIGSNGPIETADGDTDFFPWVARTDRDDAGLWAYNSQNQLIDFDNGNVLPLTSTETIGSSTVTYMNARGEATDENGVLLN